MAFDNADPTFLEAAVRKGEFRELAREIVAKDRDYRKFGRTVNTAGSIVQAMEAAYKLGLAHAGSGATASATVGRGRVTSDGAVPWNTIPPRPRSVFESIMRFKWIVIERHAQIGMLHSDEVCCYWDRGQDWKRGERFEAAQTFSIRTLAPLLRIGLMETKPVGEGNDKVYAPTAKALATWAEALADGHVRV